MFSFIKMMNKTQDRERECKESQKMVSLCLQEIQSLKEKVEHNASDIDDLSETVSKIYDDKNSICQMTKIDDSFSAGFEFPGFFQRSDHKNEHPERCMWWSVSAVRSWQIQVKNPLPEQHQDGNIVSNAVGLFRDHERMPMKIIE